MFASVSSSTSTKNISVLLSPAAISPKAVSFGFSLLSEKLKPSGMASVRIVEKELEDGGEPILYNSSGMIRNRQPGADWNPLDRNGPKQSFGQRGLHMAVLQKKIK